MMVVFFLAGMLGAWCPSQPIGLVRRRWAARGKNPVFGAQRAILVPGK